MWGYDDEIIMKNIKYNQINNILYTTWIQNNMRDIKFQELINFYIPCAHDLNLKLLKILLYELIDNILYIFTN